MKKMGTRQMILTLLGSVVCKIGVMGCYPVAPAYFTALYLENGNGLALLGIMYIGMFLFMPLTAMIKYMVILLVTALAVKLVEWANEGCPAMLAGGRKHAAMEKPAGTACSVFGSCLCVWSGSIVKQRNTRLFGVGMAATSKGDKRA